MQGKMRPPARTRLCDLDAPTLNGIIDHLRLHHVYRLTQTGDKRLRCRIAPRRVTTLATQALLRNKLQSDPPFFKHLVHLRIIAQGRHTHPRYPLEADLLPKTLVTLDALSTKLFIFPDALQQWLQKDDEPILPNLKTLRVTSFKEPLYLLSHILVAVKVIDGNVDFGASPPRGRYTDLKTIHMSAYSQYNLNLNEAMVTLDEWSPTKMTLFENHDEPSVVFHIQYFPPSLTDLSYNVSMQPGELVRVAPMLPKSLTRLCINETIPMNGHRTMIECLRPHLPHLTRLVSPGNEEVVLQNGKIHNFLLDIHRMSGSKSMHERDISDYMIYELVRRRSFNKTANIRNFDMSFVVCKFPALGFHLLGGAEGFPVAQTLCLREALDLHRWVTNPVCSWMSQFEPGMFATETQLICRWLLLLPSLKTGPRESVAEMLAYLSGQLTKPLFRKLLHLIWMVAFNPYPSVNGVPETKEVGDASNGGVIDLLKSVYGYNGFVSHTSSPFIVVSLRTHLLSQKPYVEQIIPMAFELMEDEAFADAACRGLIDSDWFDQFGEWRTAQIFKDMVGDAFMPIKHLLEHPPVMVSMSGRDGGSHKYYIIDGSNLQEVKYGAKDCLYRIADLPHSISPSKGGGTTNKRERAWLSVRTALNVSES